MKYLSNFLIALGPFGYSVTIQAQNTIPAIGGNVIGTGGLFLKKIRIRGKMKESLHLIVTMVVSL